jgi:hypothetical protein
MDRGAHPIDRIAEDVSALVLPEEVFGIPSGLGAPQHGSNVELR